MRHPTPHSNTHQMDSLTAEKLHDKPVPLPSWLIPLRLRKPVILLHAFATQVHSIVHAENSTLEQRSLLLENYKLAIDRIANHSPADTRFFADLQNMIQTHKLPMAPFYELLNAANQRIVKQRYEDMGELMNLCRRSANPLGRLMLHLLDAVTPRNIGYSDAICSALQIIQLLQNVAIDAKKDRIYFPQDEMRKFQITNQQILSADTNGTWGLFMDFEIQRARRLLQSGAPLGLLLKGWAGLELRMRIAGGERILQKLHKSNGDMFRQHPVLTPSDWVYMIYRAIGAK